ncbi:MFS transporter [Bordetella genomosp. 1]|uniref:MFS transporter n=1 Tax=Bordetella genomosp. 1 TaxID=1395607 RepID=A0ABX4EZH0_9BORD|nr:MFS transporter [Bordetella genomosp. 1]OZI65146.1 MFS transporter [Bordetella genomosp. 1]
MSAVVLASPAPAQPAQAAHWGGIYAMTLCVFALIASEFLPVSLLSPIAAALAVSEGLAGQGIAISGAFAVLTSLCIARLAGGMDRKTLLLALTALMALSGALVAWSPDYATYLVGRALIGVVIGGFWSLSAATAMRLVPARSVPRALAIFNGGNALATVVAPPLGSYLGTLVGWRGAFLCLVPVALLALAWQWRSLPAMPPAAAAAAPRRAGPLGLLRQRRVVVGVAASGLFFMGQFALFTYVQPFLANAVGAGAAALSLILLTIGVAGLFGTALIGGVIRRSLYAPLVVIPLLMAGIALALASPGVSVAAAGVWLGLWGLLATAAPVGWWSWLAQALPHDAEAGGGLMVAVIQLSIAAGSTAGGLLYDQGGHRSTFLTSAFVLLAAACLAWRAARLHAAARP